MCFVFSQLGPVLCLISFLSPVPLSLESKFQSWRISLILVLWHICEWHITHKSSGFCCCCWICSRKKRKENCSQNTPPPSWQSADVPYGTLQLPASNSFEGAQQDNKDCVVELDSHLFFSPIWDEVMLQSLMFKTLVFHLRWVWSKTRLVPA